MCLSVVSNSLMHALDNHVSMMVANVWNGCWMTSGRGYLKKSLIEFPIFCHNAAHNVLKHWKIFKWQRGCGSLPLKFRLCIYIL